MDDLDKLTKEQLEEMKAYLVNMESQEKGNAPDDKTTQDDISEEDRLAAIEGAKEQADPHSRFGR